jgi:5'-3' exonuclease
MGLIDRIAIIDLDPLIHIIANRHFNSGNKGDELTIALNVKTFVDSILKGANSTKYLLFHQGKNHANFRNKILPQYKEHRKSTEAIEKWKPFILNQLELLGSNPLKTIESDDALNLFATYYGSTGIEYIIVENDKDLACIPGLHYNPYKKNLDNKFFEYTEEMSLLMKWSQAISGDPTDMPSEFCGVRGLATKGFDWNKPADKQILGKAQKLLLNLSESEMKLKTIQTYIEKYGYEIGLHRAYITYKMISLVDKFTFNKETANLFDLEPLEYTNPTKNLFKKPKISRNLL